MSSTTFKLLQLLVLLSILSVGLRTDGSDEPMPTPWPEQFNAMLFTNHTLTGKIMLQMNDLWYDWPNRRTMNRIQYQLGDYLRDIEWNNGTSYYFTSGSNGTCTTRLFSVGVLPPEWLAGATYLGRTWTDGFECHVYTKVDFIFYYEEVGTGRPVRWYFTDGICPIIIYIVFPTSVKIISINLFFLVIYLFSMLCTSCTILHFHIQLSVKALNARSDLDKLLSSYPITCEKYGSYSICFCH
ncbi:hypothetical protein LUZ60_002018 [Juncus effusus]|nr:hypothetical protein LUZ60_002018 [Juncus effusus]